MPAFAGMTRLVIRCAGQAAPILFCAVALAVTACATTGPRSHPAFVFEGSEQNLLGLVAAARSCGFADAAITRDIPGGPLVVLIDIPARADARFDCTMRWIRDHPETGFFQDR